MSSEEEEEEERRRVKVGGGRRVRVRQSDTVKVAERNQRGAFNCRVQGGVAHQKHGDFAPASPNSAATSATVEISVSKLLSS